MKKALLFCFILVTCYVLRVSPILADDEVRHMSVDLKGKGFTQSTWQDNLESKQIIFGPGDKFQLQLTITNNGNRNQTNIHVKQTLPSDVTTDYFPETIINQIVPGQAFVQNITVTVKDKPYVLAALTANTLRYDITTDVDSKAGDYLTFYTNNGTRSATVASSSATKGGLPATGANILLISGIVSAIGVAAFGLRKYARGY